MAGGLLIRRIKIQPLDRTCVEGRAAAVPVEFAVELVAARFRDGANYTSEGAAVLCLKTVGFHLHFLQKLIDGVLP